MKSGKSISERVFNIFNITLLVGFSVTILYPFLNVLAISFNEGSDAMRAGIYIWSRVFSTQAYEAIFAKAGLLRVVMNSVMRTVLGTVLGLGFTALLSYIMSNRELIFRKAFIFFFIFTMYFSGGIIPDFILISKLGLYDKFLVYFVPCLFAGWNFVIMRSFFENLPESLKESARIDGCSELRIFYRIILPISKPVLATVALYIAVGQWNAWYDTYIYTKSPHLQTLQGLLIKIITETEAQFLAKMQQYEAMQAVQEATPRTIQMAVIMISTVPIILVYPFLQRYFVKGVMIGAVKG